MAENPDQDAKTAVDTDDAATEDQEDLFGDLSSLLEEEGASLSDEDADDADLEAILAEDEPDAEEKPPAAPAATSHRQRGNDRSARGRNRQRAKDEFRNIEARIQTKPLGLKISDDRMTAEASLITADDSYEDILALLAEQKIVYGIDEKAIRAATARASGGNNQYEIVLAKGTAPQLHAEARIHYHLPKELREGGKDEALPLFERLKHAIENPRLDAIKAWDGPVKIVHPGEAIAELEPAQYEEGRDIYGEPVLPDLSNDVQLQAGENTSIDEDGTRVVADIYGYAGLLGEVPAVVPPIWVSGDNMEARFVHIAPPEKVAAPAKEDIAELLSLKWIEHGIMKKQLGLLQKRLEQQQSVAVALPLAKGTEVEPGEDATLHYAFDSFEIIKWSPLQSILNARTPEALQSALDQFFAANAEEDQEVLFTATTTGDTIIEKVPATQGRPGIDIQGEEVEAEPGADVEIEAGENIEISADGLRALSQVYGFICLRWDIEVNIFSPLWIAEDGSVVYFLNLPQSGAARFPSQAEIRALLEQAEVKYGFDEEKWLERVEQMKAGTLTDYLVPVAEADPAEEGQDARFEWAVDTTTNTPGRILEDGTIDFKDRNLQTVVKANDMVGKLYPPKQGTPGIDVFKNVIEPKPPLAIEIVTDTHIYAEAEDGYMAFFAETEGGLSTEEENKPSKRHPTKRIQISIYPISNIEGDVDYSTGNVDFNGDVVVKGSVQAQFSIKATGSVTVGGFIETGAYITAGGDVMVKNGILGTGTEVVSGGDVLCKFIQEATVRAKGDIRVGSYIFNASVRAGGTLTVTGKGEGNARALVGGFAWGAKGIVSKSIGSPYNTGTRLVTGVDPDLIDRLDQLRANLHSCDEKQKRLAEAIGVDQVDIERIKLKLRTATTEEDKKKILTTIKRLARVAELTQNLEKEIEEIGQTQRQLSFKSRIVAQTDIFAGVELRLGEHTQYLTEDASQASFRLLTEDDETRIQMDLNAAGD